MEGWMPMEVSTFFKSILNNNAVIGKIINI